VKVAEAVELMEPCCIQRMFCGYQPLVSGATVEALVVLLAVKKTMSKLRGAAGADHNVTGITDNASDSWERHNQRR